MHLLASVSLFLVLKLCGTTLSFKNKVFFETGSHVVAQAGLAIMYTKDYLKLLSLLSLLSFAGIAGIYHLQKFSPYFLKDSFSLCSPC